MGGFFGELTKELAKRWVSLLALPGVLFLAAVAVAAGLGQAHALDPALLATTAERLGRRVAAGPVAVQVLVVVGAVLGASLAGLVVRALVGPVRTLCLGEWPPGLRRLAGACSERRRRRWHRLLARRRAAEAAPSVPPEPGEQREADRLADRMNAIALAEPGRPTWMGDRMHAVAAIARDRYGLDLAFGWSRLWLVLPEEARAEINAVQRGFATAMVTTAWSVPYLLLGALWWPSALVAVVVALVGRSRGRDQIGLLGDLVEAALDLHGRTLATALGVGDASAGPLGYDEGRDVSDIVRKGR